MSNDISRGSLSIRRGGAGGSTAAAGAEAGRGRMIARQQRWSSRGNDRPFVGADAGGGGWMWC